MIICFQSMPKSLMTSWPHMPSQFQRIVYKALPTKSEITQKNSLRKILVLETLPRSVSDVPEDSNSSKPSQIICCHRSIETHADILLPSRYFTTTSAVPGSNQMIGQWISAFLFLTLRQSRPRTFQRSFDRS